MFNVRKRIGISDWLANGGSKEKLIELVKNTPLWAPHVQTGLNSNIDDENTVFHFTDTGNAHRLVKLFGDQIRFNAKPHKSWFIWDGTRWEDDTTNKIHSLVDLTIRDI